MDPQLKTAMAAAAGRSAARGRLRLRRGPPRLARHLVALERAEQRLYEVLRDDPSPPAELISPFVADIQRLRREEQDLRDRLARRGRLRRSLGFARKPG